jgi:phosphoserine aminotransferase
MVEGKTIYNFSAGPCVLPKEVLQTAADETLSWHGCGVSVHEMSHRSKEFIQIVDQAEKDFREFFSVPKEFEVFFLLGGASGQMSAIPYNILKGNTKVNYITTGYWSKTAAEEAARLATVVEAWPDSGSKFTTIPDVAQWHIDKEAAYFHYCDNETIHGLEFNNFPYDAVEGMTLVCDASSNFGTRHIDWEKYGVVYAGA